MSETATLGQLIDALDVNAEALIEVAKRAPKVKPNGSLRGALDRMREAKAMLEAATALAKARR